MVGIAIGAVFLTSLCVLSGFNSVDVLLGCSVGMYRLEH